MVGRVKQKIDGGRLNEIGIREQGTQQWATLSLASPGSIGRISLTANKDDLLRSINKVHSESIETQFKERLLEIIEGSTTTEGDFIIIISDSVNQDCYYF